MDNEEDKPEGKLDSWLNDITCTQHKNLRGQVIWDIMCTWCKSWAVDSAESCNIWLYFNSLEMV